MALSADLEAEFGQGGFSLTSTLELSAGDLGSVAFDPSGIDLDALAVAVDGIGSVDTSSIGSIVEGVLARLTDVVGALPGVDDAIEPLRAVLALAEVVTGPGIGDAIGAIDGAVTNDGLEGIAALEARLGSISALRHNPSVQGLVDLTSSVVGDGFDLDSTAGDLGRWLTAIRELVTLVGGLMAIETNSATLGRLTELGAEMLTPADVTAALAGVTRFSGVALADLLVGIDPDDAGLVDLVAPSISEYSLALRRMAATLARGMAFGEATLAAADIAALAERVETATTGLREDGLDAVRSVAEEVQGWLAPLLDIDLPDAHATTDAFADAVVGAVGDLAGAIDQLDPALLAGPLTTAFADAFSVFDAVAAAAEEVRTLLAEALATVRGLVESIDLGPIVDTIRTALEPLANALDSVEGLIGDAQAGIETAAGAAVDALRDVQDSLGTAADAVRSAFERIDDVIDALGLDALQETLDALIAPVAQFLAGAQLAPYFDTANDAIDTASDVIDAVPFDMLPDDALQELADAIEPVKQIDFQRDVADVLIARLAEIVDALDTEVLAAIEAAYADVVGFLDSVDPADALAAFETNAFDPMIEAVRSVDLEVVLSPLEEAIAPVRDAIAGFDPVADVLQPIEDLVDQVADVVRSFDPSAALVPIEEQVDAVRSAVSDELRLDEWSGWLDRAEEIVIDALARLDLTDLVAALDGAHDSLIAEVRDGAGGPSVVGAVISGLTAGMGLTSDSLGTVVGWIGGIDGAGEIEQRFRAAAAGVDAQLAAVEAVDLQALINGLQPSHRALVGALELHPAGSFLRLRLDAEVAAASPQDLFGPLLAGYATYVATLRDDAVAVRRLATAGRSQITAVSQGLREALRPLQSLVDRARSLLARLGLDTSTLSLREMVVELLATFRPSRLLVALTNAIDTLRDRLEQLAIAGVIGPVRDAVNSVEATLAAVDIGFVRSELSAVHGQVLSLVDGLSPSALLGDVLTELTELQAAFVSFDPLGPVRGAVDELSAVIDEVDTEFRPTVLFAPIVDLYQRIVDALGALDLGDLLQPVLDGLAVIELQLGEGLTATASSLTRLQEALPSASSLGGAGGGDSVGFG